MKYLDNHRRVSNGPNLMNSWHSRNESVSNFPKWTSHYVRQLFSCFLFLPIHQLGTEIMADKTITWISSYCGSEHKLHTGVHTDTLTHPFHDMEHPRERERSASLISDPLLISSTANWRYCCYRPTTSTANLMLARTSSVVIDTH